MTDAERNASPCYVALKPCGCMVAAMVDDILERPDRAKHIGEELAAWKKGGLTIQRVTVADVRLNWRDCPHEPKQEVLL